MDPALIAASRIGAPPVAAQKLSEVTLVAVGCESLPEAAQWWPVRAILAQSNECNDLRNTYLCGRVNDVVELLRVIPEAPLAILVDQAPEDSISVDVEIVPGLQSSGLESSVAWEAVVSAVCRRHTETIQHMIFEHAQRTPDKVALIYEDRSWTFREVVSMACSVGSELQLRGITPAGGILAVQALASDRLIILYLGLYSARYLFQIVDSHPESRAYRLETCPCQAILCERGPRLPEGIQHVFIEDLQLDSSRPLHELSVGGDISDPAFIEYTSGSTGKPKSVITWQWRIAHWVRWRHFHFPFKPDDDREARNLFFIWYWHITMCQGGTTIVYPTKLNYDIVGLMQYARKHSVSRFDCLTPGLLSALLEVEDSLPESLKVMISGGEALPTSTCRAWLSKWPHCALWNNYAVTEASADISFCRITPKVAEMDVLYAPISDGCVAWQNEIKINDGIMVLQGWNVSAGYLPPFVSNKYELSSCGQQHRYVSGDRIHWSEDGFCCILGRVDAVVKVRGYNVDLAGLEAILAGCSNLKDAACIHWRDTVCTFVVTEDMTAVKQFADEKYPLAHLIVWYRASELPYTKSGKRDRQEALRMLEAGAPEFTVWSGSACQAGSNCLPGGNPTTEKERLVAAVWKAVLGRDVGREEPFQQAGGHSLAAMRIAKRLGMQPAEVFAFPTIALMAARLERNETGDTIPAEVVPHVDSDVHAKIAIVGMAARFPGAPSVQKFWQSLEAGVDLISDIPAGPQYIPRKGIVPDLGLDCSFWGIPAEAARTMDTTQRALLETAYEALEDAGLDPFHVSGRVGVIVSGGSVSHYVSETLGINIDECRTERPDEYFALEIGTDKDYLATTIAYRLNLHGPAEIVQTACSSSLVSVVRAVQLLRLRICDYVVCGGASFSPDAPVKKVDGMIWSPDGICRPFADGANGTVNSDGCGLVVLTRLEDAQQKNERVYATVLGAASNNDGARKAGFSAPSFEGQVEVLRSARTDAGVRSDEVDYIEAHGTGTKLGDPLELHALTESLGPKHSALFGSVKGNIGHLNTAAGIPGFIKTALMLHHQRMVPSLHADCPNPLIDWDKTSLRLATTSHNWGGKVAGVSSFGVGGTNAHVVLGVAPCTVEDEPPRSIHVFTASAKSQTALEEQCSRLSTAIRTEDFIRAESTLLARPKFVHRAFALRPEDLPTAPKISNRRPVVLLFPGQGGAYSGMGSYLEKEGLVSCECEGSSPVDIVKASLAVAEALQHQGLVVEAALGHSVGEWAAAAFAGVFSKKDCLDLATLRGNLMSTMDSGIMVSVRAALSQVEDLARDGVEVACVNGGEAVVLAGPVDAMSTCIAELERRDIAAKQLQTKHAFHTAAVDPILPAYAEALRSVSYSSARLPVLSNVTGEWYRPEATCAEYWEKHLRQPVLFHDNLERLAQRFPVAVIVEVGPSVLAGVVAREAARLGVDWQVVPTMRERDELATYMRCLGTLWTHADLQLNLPSVRQTTVSLPNYPFERKSLVAKRQVANSSDRKSIPIVSRAPVKSEDPVANMLYETALESIECSCLQTEEATVLLDGDVLPKGLPKRIVQTNYDRAVVAAQACGYLLFIGSSISFPTADDTSQEKLIKNVVSLLRSLTKAKAKVEVFFYLRANLRYAAIRGLLRSAAREHPELRLRNIELHDDAQLVLPVLAGEYIVKADGVYVQRLRSAPIPRSVDLPHVFTRALVTGGLRGLGVKVAEWLVSSKRAMSLVLMGRHQAEGEAANIVQRLQSDVHVDICIGDVSQWADVQKLPECDLVVHMAGNVKDGLLLHASDDDMQRVLRPKIRGAVHLKNHLPKARMLGFSSSSGVFGTAGQASYAAANTFLDAIMPTVQWGGWGEVGMALDLNIAPSDGERFFPVSAGLDCIGRVLDTPERPTPLMALDVDWHLYRHNKDAFSPEDPLLANVDGQPQPLSILGTPQVRIESFAWSWELVSGPEGSRFRGSCPAWDVCRQHVVGNTTIFPGTAFVALALEAAKQVGVSGATLTNIEFLRPLELAAPRRLMTALVQNDDGSKGGSIRFSSQPIRTDGQNETDDNAPAIVHCTCNFSLPAKIRPQPIPMRDMCETTNLYTRFADAGFHYGPAFRSPVVETSTSTSVARCEFISHSKAFFQLHPAALDTAMHLVALLHPSGLNGVPHKLRQLQVFTETHPVEARAVLDGIDLELQLLDDVGDVVCNIKGLDLAPLEVPPTLQLRARTWRELPQEQKRGLWLLSGQEAIDLDLPEVTKNRSESYDAEIFAVTAATLEDVHLCAEKARAISARTACWVVAVESQFAEAAAAAAVEMGAHAVIGTKENVQKLSCFLTFQSPSIVYASGDGKLLVEQLEEVRGVAPVVAGPSEAFVVEVDPSKGAKGAKCHGAQRRPPAAHEVEVKASLWALNFRDVLVAVGAIPAEVAGQKLGIGGECYGEVVNVGENVSNLSVGDLVVAVPPDGMGSFATIDSQWVGIAPPAMTPEEAVSGTAVYATAWLGLHWLAHISGGEKVLIHSAAGGVGLAAINLCLRAGCTVYATASTAEKREFLLSLGVAAAFDSRNVADFVDGIKLVTKGEGVDVVLNSLSGEAIEASMRLLSPFGRFIEIGKRDQYEDTKVGLSPFLNGIMYAAAHLDVLMLRQPKRCRKLLEEVWAVMPELPKLPSTTFKMDELDKALEYFSKGIHVGKLLISIGQQTPVHAAHPSTILGPVNDTMTQALKEKLGATEGKGGVVCIRNLSGLTNTHILDGAQMVLTSSRAVADVAHSLDPQMLSIILPHWEPIANVQEWFGLQGRFVATEEEKDGNLEEWLMEVVQEMAGTLRMDQSFESVGLDSLALISLARRLSAKIGKAVSVVDLYDNPTPQQLLASLSGGPQAQLSLPKVVCLHGFRTNREIMSFACAHFVSAMGSVEWIFINAPRRASGPTDPKIPLDMEAYEWWGQKDGCYETGWMAPHFDGLEDTLPVVRSLAPSGIVGFSQGAAVATLIECKWLALFSAVMPPGIKNRETPSFHSYDLAEDFAAQCAEVTSYFSNKELHTHGFGHTIPQDDVSTKAFVSFVAAHL